MIIVQTPVRLELLGGGTDMEYFYRHHPGRVLNVTLNRYIYVTVGSNFEGKIKVRYSKNEYVDYPPEVKHTRIRAALDYFKIKGGVEIVSIGDIPAGSGLGSSGSFTVGLVQALAGYLGRKMSVREIAELACHLEIGVLKEPIGKQDQYAAAFGGLNLMAFQKNGRVRVKPLRLPTDLEKRFQSYLMMIYTGSTRQASQILKEQKRNLKAKIPILKKMAGITKEGAKILKQGDLRGFAQLLEAEWQVKKNLAPISNRRIDSMYQKSLQAGAWGGRVSGAGQGGFIVLLVPPNKQSSVEKAFPDKVIFKPIIIHRGSRVVFKR